MKSCLRPLNAVGRNGQTLVMEMAEYWTSSLLHRSSTVTPQVLPHPDRGDANGHRRPDLSNEFVVKGEALIKLIQVSSLSTR